MAKPGFVVSLPPEEKHEVTKLCIKLCKMCAVGPDKAGGGGARAHIGRRPFSNTYYIQTYAYRYLYIYILYINIYFI